MTVLERIFQTKREEVERAKALLPLEELRARVRDLGVARGFRAALETRDDLALIAEVKKASPSKGIIRADFDAAEIARAYESAGANALSVLTDEPYFQGSAENLRGAKEATRLPCLRKDFIDDPYQIYEARAWGADAVLLIAAWLSPSQISDLEGLASDLGMDALVEVHSPEEASVVTDLGCPLVGVNNRDLADFVTDLAYSDRILPLVTRAKARVSE
ncbi:MAG TPA: indole-3-glycerol phosphate synthase TrpC, partial [Fimbriimonas sp.]